MLRSLIIATAVSWAGIVSAAPLKAVASITIIADMVHEVGGDLVEVQSIVGPDGDAHAYESSPQDSKNLSVASVVFVNGLGLDTWIEKITQASGFKGPIVTTTDGIKPHQMNEDGKDILDPHAWQDLSNGQIYVKNIAEGLCKADANDCDKFRTNATAYNNKLVALDQDVRAKFASLPASARQVVTTHDAFGYFATAYDLRFLAPEGFSTESEPSADAVAKIIRQIKQDKIKALFFENMSDPRVIEAIAAETGVRPGPPLYADALSKPDEGADTYIKMFQHNTETLMKAMAGN